MSQALQYIKDRVGERTSWDGAVIVAVALAIICFGGLAKVAAWIALAYGAWTIVKSE